MRNQETYRSPLSSPTDFIQPDTDVTGRLIQPLQCAGPIPETWVELYYQSQSETTLTS